MFDWNLALLAPFNPEAETVLQSGYYGSVSEWEGGWLGLATSRYKDGNGNLRKVYPTKELAKAAVEQFITENGE